MTQQATAEGVPVYHERTKCLVGYMRDMRVASAAHRGLQNWLCFSARQGRMIAFQRTVIVRFDVKIGKLRLWVEKASDLCGVEGFRLD